MRSTFLIRFGSAFLALILFQVTSAPAETKLRPAAGPFPDGPIVTFKCLLDNSETKGWFPNPRNFGFRWDRENGVTVPNNPQIATTAGQWTEVAGFENRDGSQFVAHFVPAEVATRERFDHRYQTSLFSIRSDNVAVMTEHSIIYGNVKALTQSGTCTLVPQPEGTD